MRFEEALKYLRQGKKIRRKNWGNEEYVYIENNNLTYSGRAYCLEASFLLDDKWELYEDNILDEKEKEYLSAVIKPFRDRVKYITKQGMSDSEKEHICIFTDQWITDLPMFKQGTMYKGMNLDEQYTLKELGL